MKSSSPDMCVRLHTLTMVPEGPDVMVGRPDVGSYAVFPTEGAEILRRLEELESPADQDRRVAGGRG